VLVLEQVEQARVLALRQEREREPALQPELRLPLELVQVPEELEAVVPLRPARRRLSPGQARGSVLEREARQVREQVSVREHWETEYSLLQGARNACHQHR
jgi:hypothetical protein